MELHSNLYYKHTNPDITSKIDQLFKDHQGDADTFIALATAIHPENGQRLQPI